MLLPSAALLKKYPTTDALAVAKRALENEPIRQIEEAQRSLVSLQLS